MKHVFGIASHLTFNMARKIIEVDNIHDSECCFLMLRNYSMPPEYKDKFSNSLSTSYNTDEKHGRIFEGWRIWRTRENMRTFDKVIDELTSGENFIWYTSVCYNDICSMMVTNHRCLGYYVMEDGLISYERDVPTFRGWKYWFYKGILLKLYPRIFVLKNHLVCVDHPKFKGCIASSPLSFPEHQEKVRVIGSPFVPKVYDICPDAVISVDPFFFKGISNDVVERVYNQLSKYMRSTKSYKCIAYKFHPRFYVPDNIEQKEAYRAILSSSLGEELIELPKDVVLENLLSWCKADFYSCDSSVALYASQMKVRCFSMMPLLEGTPAYHPTEIMNKISIAIK